MLADAPHAQKTQPSNTAQNWVPSHAGRSPAGARRAHAHEQAGPSTPWPSLSPLAPGRLTEHAENPQSGGRQRALLPPSHAARAAPKALQPQPACHAGCCLTAPQACSLNSQPRPAAAGCAAGGASRASAAAPVMQPGRRRCAARPARAAAAPPPSPPGRRRCGTAQTGTACPPARRRRARAPQHPARTPGSGSWRAPWAVGQPRPCQRLPPGRLGCRPDAGHTAQPSPSVPARHAGTRRTQAGTPHCVSAIWHAGGTRCDQNHQHDRAPPLIARRAERGAGIELCARGGGRSRQRARAATSTQQGLDKPRRRRGPRSRGPGAGPPRSAGRWRPAPRARC